jgi:carbon storage regulator
MLVLSRQRDETIMIGDEIEITVVDIRGDKVRLGITAPTRIAVHRKEVYEAIKLENEQAARLGGTDVAALGAVLSPGPARAIGRAGAQPDPRRAARLLAEQAKPPPPGLSPQGPQPIRAVTTRPANA